MRNQWSASEAARVVERFGPRWGEDLALQVYGSSLLGAEKELAAPGGGTLSLKSTRPNVLGENVPALFLMRCGQESPAEHIALDLAYLRRMRGASALTDDELFNEFRTHLFDFRSPAPPPETLAHAFLEAKFVVHARSNAVLALASGAEGRRNVAEALGEGVMVVPYARPGLELARATAEASGAAAGARAVIWAHHGLVTWGETACAAYSSLIELLTRAEEYLDRRARRPGGPAAAPQELEDRLLRIAPIVRGLIARKMCDSDQDLGRVIVRPLSDRGILELLASERGKALAQAQPLECGHLALTKPFPLWVDAPDYGDLERLRGQLRSAMEEYSRDYEAYCSRNGESGNARRGVFDSTPRVVLLPGLGALCAGPDAVSSAAVRGAAEAMLAAKARIPDVGDCPALPEPELFRLERGVFQRSALGTAAPAPLAGRVALVTGAAGAIGSGISEGLLRQGCAVALADLPGDSLTALVEELRGRYGDLAMALPFDVAVPSEVAAAFGRVILTWGGLDLVVANAGIAYVSSLADMKLEAFQRLERVNIEGTLNLLSESARHFRHQDCGGDVVLISTKNVFAPGAKFGAYSATKAAAHQLARIASLEMAELGVRVNMVAPDAVFGKGTRRSGLWAEVGADRAHALGLSPDELEAYYRRRCLLKTEVTATHVANAVLYFATHQSPTTGATLPVDGGLPAATPR
jgi:rhamnose utilization protein RhaD (predicted bifunctional aldolase and dehydrogenase)/NAD(P)-dependent dehydrogenase (short-subunit alcohol dehydrogenase family)